MYLTAEDAVIAGQGPLRLEGSEKKNLGYWHSNANRVRWAFENVSQDSVYEVELLYALDPEYVGAAFVLTCGEAKLSAKVPVTSGWNDYQLLKVGKIAVPGVGRTSVSLQKQEGKALFNLRAVILRKQQAE